jgi:hypothetical protein
MKRKTAEIDAELKKSWEQILSAEGLSMHAGIHEYREPKESGEKVGKLRRRDVPVGNSMDLEILHKMLLIGASGQVRPTGASPDEEVEK